MTDRIPMTEQEEHVASREGYLFRSIIGIMCMVGSFAGLAGLYLVEVPAGNREPLLLALGIILGWSSAVVQSEYGASNTGRKVAESAIQKLNERQSAPTGTPSDPFSVAGAESGNKPVEVEDTNKT